MTFEDRAREAGEQLAAWTPAEAGSEVALGHSLRRRRRRQGALGAAAAVLIVTSTVMLWPTDEAQRVIAAEPTTTISGRECDPAAGLVTVYLNPDDDDATVRAIGDRIDGDDRVASSRYLDDAATFELYQRIFSEPNPELSGALEVGELPTSYRVVLQDDAAVPAFVADLRSVPGVYDVSTDACDRLGVFGADPSDFASSSTSTVIATDPGVVTPDIDFRVTVTSNCADFTRLPGSEREACPLPSEMRGVDSAYVRPVGTDPNDPNQIFLSPRDRVYAPGQYDVTLFQGLTDYGCAANAELRIEVAGEGADRVVTVTSIEGEPEFRGAHPTVELTMPATTTECTGMGPSAADTTSVRVELVARLRGECAPMVVCARPGLSPVLSGLDVLVTDRATGATIAGGESVVWFLGAGSYTLRAVASQADATWCNPARFAAMFDLEVGVDGALSLRSPGESGREVGRSRAPAAAPTLVPEPMDATLTLLQQPC